MNTINMYKSGGALEYIENSKIEPETDKWERLFNLEAAVESWL